jgi:EAL domain-containing protein (putative c-di-GMP-specific phosphodiesterase class I)
MTPSIVRTIIAMASSLNLEVIAEGVENEAQREFLLNNGCTNFQGSVWQTRPD